MPPVSSENPLRILHCLHSLNRGGIETWLYHVLRNRDPARFHMDFAVATDKTSDYDEEFRRLGAGIFPCRYPMRPWRYARDFSRLVEQHGPYDIVHSHFDPCGYPLIWAHREGIPIRIAHSHNASPELRSKGKFVQTVFSPLTRRWIDKHATGGLGASEKATASMFGRDWHSDSRWRVLFYGIDLSPLQRNVDRTQMRAKLNIPADALVVGHVGRFSCDDQKNHPFLVDIAEEVARRNPSAHFVFVGDGPLRGMIESQIADRGLRDQTRFLGVRSDVHHILKGVFDLFLFPSLWEGLPLALFEAQAAGLPCVISDVIARESDVVPELITRHALSESPGVWADSVLRAYENRKRPTPAEALDVVARSPFNIKASCHTLQDYYIQCAARGCRS